MVLVLVALPQPGWNTGRGEIKSGARDALGRCMGWCELVRERGGVSAGGQRMQRRRVWSFRAGPERVQVLGGERGVDVGRGAQKERAWRGRGARGAPR